MASSSSSNELTDSPVQATITASIHPHIHPDKAGHGFCWFSLDLRVRLGAGGKRAMSVGAMGRGSEGAGSEGAGSEGAREAVWPHLVMTTPFLHFGSVPHLQCPRDPPPPDLTMRPRGGVLHSTCDRHLLRQQATRCRRRPGHADASASLPSPSKMPVSI
jgi:hypothetical protein